MLRAIALAATLGLFAGPTYAGNLRFRWNGENSVDWSIRKASGYHTVARGRTSGGSSSTETLDAGVYELHIDAPGFKSMRVSVPDRGTVDVTPRVGRIKFRWRGENSVKWSVTGRGGREIGTYTTGARDSDTVDVPVELANTYSVRVDAPGFRDVDVSVYDRGLHTVEPTVGQLVVYCKTFPTLEWVLRDTGGSRLDDGRVYGGNTKTMDLAARDYELELRSSKSEEKLRFTISDGRETRVER